MTMRMSTLSYRVVIFLFAMMTFTAIVQSGSWTQAGKDLEREDWWVHSDYKDMRPRSIAVLPMVNMSLEAEVERTLQASVYQQLLAKGYQKIDASQVDAVMGKLGIQTAEQLSGVSYKRLGLELQCDAVIQGQVNQSAGQHGIVYDAVVVSCSLQLIDCRSGNVLWRCEQFRTAHRQWQLDPFNMFINAMVHESSDRDKRIAWLVQEMLRTLPAGPVTVVRDDLFERAQTVTAQPRSIDSQQEEK